MNDAKDDGNIESLLNALPPSPKPQSSRSICFLLLRTIRRKSTKHHPPGSNSKLCKLCVFESIVFESKNRQQVFKHMFSKHKVLNHFQDGIDKMRAARRQPSGSAANLPSISFAAIVSSSSSPLFVAVSASLTPSVSALPTPSFSSFDTPALNSSPLVAPSSYSSSSSTTTIVLHPQPTSSGTIIIKLSKIKQLQTN